MDTSGMESRLMRYYDGELSETEIREVESWMNESPDNMKTAEQVYYLCFAADAYEMKTSVDEGEAFRRVRSRILRNRLRGHVRRFERVAAVLLLPLLCAAAYLLSDYFKEYDTFREVRSVSGMVSCITLPDDTKVWLNSDSYLRYPARFGKERRVELCGEGYFDVSEDPKHKFIVRAKNTEVVVHGTEFNVEAYDDDSHVRTTLVSGIVDVCYEDRDGAGRTWRLRPSQQASYDVATGTMSLSEENVLCSISWKDGKVVLDNTPIEDALRMIGNKYNVHFILRDDALRHYRFTGTFCNQSLDAILRYFSISSRITFRQIDGQLADRDGLSGRSVYEVI